MLPADTHALEGGGRAAASYYLCFHQKPERELAAQRRTHMAPPRVPNPALAVTSRSVRGRHPVHRHANLITRVSSRRLISVRPAALFGWRHSHSCTGPAAFGYSNAHRQFDRAHCNARNCPRGAHGHRAAVWRPACCRWDEWGQCHRIGEGRLRQQRSRRLGH